MFQKLANSEGVGLQGLDDLTWNDPIARKQGRMSSHILMSGIAHCCRRQDNIIVRTRSQIEVCLK